MAVIRGIYNYRKDQLSSRQVHQSLYALQTAQEMVAIDLRLGRVPLFMVCPKIEMSHSRDMVRSGIYGQTVGERLKLLLSETIPVGGPY